MLSLEGLEFLEFVGNPGLCRSRTVLLGDVKWGQMEFKSDLDKAIGESG